MGTLQGEQSSAASLLAFVVAVVNCRLLLAALVTREENQQEIREESSPLSSLLFYPSFWHRYASRRVFSPIAGLCVDDTVTNTFRLKGYKRGNEPFTDVVER